MVSKPEDWSGKMDEKDKGPILITLLAPSLEWDMVKKVARGPPPLPNKAYFIFPEVLAAYLAGNDRTELAVLDLRAKGIDEDTNKKIPGAFNWPWVENYEAMKTDEKIWTEELAKSSVVQFIATSKLIKNVVIHCVQGTNRTPAAAIGYQKFVIEARGVKQRVLLIPSVLWPGGKTSTGGFTAYKAAAEKNLVRLEDWIGADYKKP